MTATQFDNDFYFSQRPDVLLAIINGGYDGSAEDHYNAHGWREGSDPNAQFDTSYYLAAYPDVLAAGVNPFQHFVEYGSSEGRPASGQGPTGGGQDQFDPYFYFSQRPDVLLAIINGGYDGSAEDHYNAHGWREGSDPNAQFDTSYYLAAYPDVLAAGVNPFQHFVEYGSSEGRPASGQGPTGGGQDQFDPYFYFSQRPDVLLAIINGGYDGSAEDHYNAHGWREGSDPNAQFDTSYYLEANPDVLAAGVNPFQHFVEYGIDEGRSGTEVQGITLDGSLADWGSASPLAAASATAPGYVLYGTYEDDAFVLALQAPVPIGPNTTLWFNTDLDTATGFPIFGLTSGGAEFNINFDSLGVPALYTGDAGQILVPDAPPLEYAIGTGGAVLEIALPSALLGGARNADLYVDVNNNEYLPDNFFAPGYLIGEASLLT